MAPQKYILLLSYQVKGQEFLYVKGVAGVLITLKSYSEREERIMNNKIPYKIYLEEHEMPKQWYNVRADMKKKPAPLLNSKTMQPITLDELSEVFCRELAKQELDDTTPYFDIPEEIRDFYKMYRPSPLVRAYCLE